MDKKIILIITALLFSMQLPALSAQKLNIYCEDDRPMQFVGADGILTGMSVEIVQEIKKRVGNSDPIKMVPWARGLNEVTNTPNTVLFSMARTAERNQLFQWVGPIAETAFALYAKANSTIKITELDDAKKIRSIGVYRDDIRDQFLTKAGFTNLERTDDNVSNFKKLMAGRFDMYASSSNDIKGNAESAGYKLSDVRLVYIFLRSQVYMAMSKGTNVAIVAQWNDALKKMKEDGTFSRIFKKYYPDNELPGPEISKF
ncbi:MAG: transporter substrate-binding domain-containing protein [Oligoflexia bacterium]|nr:transporter substrate-binding domain-containing protein [Oligoflexia bacterium]